MWKIDFEKIKQDKLDQQYHRPANVGAYKWWKRHAEEVIRRCIEDEYRR